MEPRRRSTSTPSSRTSSGTRCSGASSARRRPALRSGHSRTQETQDRRSKMRHGLISSVLMFLAATATAQEREAHEKSEESEAAKATPALATALKEAKGSLATGFK